MDKKEILKQKKHGDLKQAATILGISEQNAYAALNRVGSKHHENVVKTLSRIIRMREELKKEIAG